MTELVVLKRKNRDGIDCVAPFINGFNVWDIPEKEWTYAVQKAVISAYVLGIKHTKEESLELIRNVSYHVPDTDQKWKL